MCEIVKWEMLKIIRDRKNQIAFWVGTIGMMLFVYGLISNDTAFISKDVDLISGVPAIKQQKEFRRSLEGELTEERIGKDIQYFQSQRENFFRKIGNSDEWTEEGWEYYSPREDYFALINGNYNYEEVDESGYANLLRVQLENGNARFYETRDAMVYSLLFDEETWYSKAESEYWMNRYKELDDTIYYGDCLGWQELIDNAYILVMPLFLVCFCLSSVYAGEYEKNTYSILLTTRKGKETLVTAKKVASVGVALVIFTVELIIYHMFTFALCGVEGADCKVQAGGIYCLYNVTYKQAAWMNIGLSYLVLLAISMISIFLSAKTKNVLSGFFVVVICVMGAMFLKQPVTYEMARMRVLMPDCAIGMFSTTSQSPISYMIGNVLLNQFQMGTFVYGLLSVLFFKFAGHDFKKYC